jgi:D-glycero-D-manno-heptose 1,7-bisphosphate phosphatase
LSRAIFLDRDGVVNRNVFYSDSGCYESPRSAAELELIGDAATALHRFRSAGFRLILVSNQPNAAKKKCTQGEMVAIAGRLNGLLDDAGIALDATYYCHHHPEVTGPCVCRKPSAYFLRLAAEQFGLDLPQCWMIGDRATDVECGRRAFCRTIWINNGEGTAEVKQADFRARSLAEAADLVLSETASRTVALGSMLGGGQWAAPPRL